MSHRINTHTQQNLYSICHLLCTVTTQWLPLWRCSHCSLVPDTVTTEHWLHQTHVIRYLLLWGLCRNLSTRHLVGNCTVTTWEDTIGTRYTQSLWRSQGGKETWFCSLPLVPLVGERIVTTSSLSSHSTVTTWGVLLCSLVHALNRGIASQTNCRVIPPWRTLLFLNHTWLVHLLTLCGSAISSHCYDNCLSHFLGKLSFLPKSELHGIVHQLYKCPNHQPSKKCW